MLDAKQGNTKQAAPPWKLWVLTIEGQLFNLRYMTKWHYTSEELTPA